MSFLNKLKNKVNQVVSAVVADEETQKERIAICNACPALSSIRQCRVCLCLVDAKTKLKEASCPEKKWHPVFDNNI